MRGDLDDIAGGVAATKAADGVIHLGYKHDLAFGGTPDGFVTAAEHDVRVVTMIGEPLVGSNERVVLLDQNAFVANHERIAHRRRGLATDAAAMTNATTGGAP